MCALKRPTISEIDSKCSFEYVGKVHKTKFVGIGNLGIGNLGNIVNIGNILIELFNENIFRISIARLPCLNLFRKVKPQKFFE